MFRIGWALKLVLYSVFIPFDVFFLRNQKTIEFRLFSFAFYVYMINLISIVFFPITTIPSEPFRIYYNLMPLKSLGDLYQLNIAIFSKQIIGNIFLFFPFGFLAPDNPRVRLFLFSFSLNVNF